MKLYTEEQVTKINLQSKDWGHYDNSIFAFEISDNENIYTEQEIKETLKLMGLELLVNEFLKKAEPIAFNQNNQTYKQTNGIEVDAIKSQVTTTDVWTPKTN